MWLTTQQHRILHRARRDGEVVIEWDSSQEHAAQQIVKEGLLRVNEEKSLIVCLTKNETIYESTKEKADA